LRSPLKQVEKKRQYFPRGTDLSGYSQEQLDQVSLLLNQRPRKT
jgi:IS30 family transposase